VVTLQEIIARIKESGTVPTASTSSAASLTQAAEDVEPDDTMSDPAVLLTSCERAKDVERDLLTLDPKLAVFTVVGTQEPRLVKLFPGLSCSCSATEICYHMMAAKMAVGMTLIQERSTLRNYVAMETSQQDFRQEAAATARCQFRNFKDFQTEKELNKT